MLHVAEVDARIDDAKTRLAKFRERISRNILGGNGKRLKSEIATEQKIKDEISDLRAARPIVMRVEARAAAAACQERIRCIKKQIVDAEAASIEAAGYIDDALVSLHAAVEGFRARDLDLAALYREMANAESEIGVKPAVERKAITLSRFAFIFRRAVWRKAPSVSESLGIVPRSSGVPLNSLRQTVADFYFEAGPKGASAV